MNTKALNNISYGLYLLSAEENGKANGCIINTAVQQTSTAPIKISVTVNKQNLTHDMILNSGKFNISTLSEKTPFEVFKHFGFSSGRDTDKITGCELLHISGNGIVYLKKFANSYISAEVTDKIDLGSHTLFIATVTDCDVLSDEPSVTYEYYNNIPRSKCRRNCNSRSIEAKTD